MQGLQEKRELVSVYNDLCSTLLDVQVTLSQNKPQTMTGQDRNAAAARFQSSMQVTSPVVACVTPGIPWHVAILCMNE